MKDVHYGPPLGSPPTGGRGRERDSAEGDMENAGLVQPLLTTRGALELASSCSVPSSWQPWPDLHTLSFIGFKWGFPILLGRM